MGLVGRIAILGASMRPGPIRPGDVEHLEQVGPEPEASMRPGPIRPGDVAGHKHATGRKPLQ